MNLFHRFILMSTLTGIVACSSKPVVHDFPPTATPAEEIANLEKDLSSAKERQVDVLSPKNFKEAQDSLEDAKKKFMDGKDSEQTLHKVALGKAYLNNAHNAATVARENIEDVIAARQAALKAEAPAYFSREFKNADEDFVSVTKDIEKNKLTSAAKERSELQAKYLGLEGKAIQEKHLKESRDIIALAKKEGAEKFAPRILTVAEKSYADTEAYIKANPHNTEVIVSRAKETKDAAYHALNINRTAKGTSKVSSEEMAIAIEKEKERTLKSEKKVNSVEDELETTQSALAREKAAQGELEAQKGKLEAEKSLNEKYEAARKQFASDEAEVYRQGDALLIRLKGMEFPSSTATIQSKNYPLLLKVEKVVEEFGTGAAITVEGHTDSVGGKTINNRLSAERAKAVKDYLQANGGAEANIETIGYGDQKPLATNKTATGRAQNRRVDIIIKPENIKL